MCSLVPYHSVAWQRKTEHLIYVAALSLLSQLAKLSHAVPLFLSPVMLMQELS